MLSAVGCGRVSFDALDASTDADVDPPIRPVRFASSHQLSGAMAQVATAVAATGNDGFVVGGHTDAAFDAGGGTLGLVGLEDAFLASFTTAGVHRWSRSFGSAGNDVVFDMDSDNAGNVYVTGHVAGPTDFGGGVRAAFGNLDIFIASYAPDGAHRWSRILGSTGNGEIGFGLAIDETTLYATGWFDGTVDFGDAVRTPAAGQDVYLIVLDPATGMTTLSRRFGGSGLDQGQKIAVATDGIIGITGVFGGTTNLGNGDVTSAGSHDAFAIVGDPTAPPAWTRSAGGTNSDRAHDIVFGPDGETYVCGWFESTAFDWGVDAATSTGLADGYVVRFAQDGAPLWMRTFMGSGRETLDACTFGADRSVVVAGTHTSPTSTLGGDPMTTAGVEDIAVAAYSRQGALAWQRSFGGGGVDSMRAIAAAPDGAIYVVGTFDGSANFGDMPRVATGADAFILRLVPDDGN